MKVQRVTFPVTSVALLLLACHGGPGGKSDAGGGGGGGGDDGGGAGATGWGSGTMISDARSFLDYELSADAVDVNESGVAVALWVERITASGMVRLWGNVYRGGVWSTPTVLGDPGSGDGSVSVMPNGDAMVVYVQSQHVQAKRYLAASDNWTSSAPISADSPAGTFPISPGVATDGLGNAIAVWSQGNQVWARCYDASTSAARNRAPRPSCAQRQLGDRRLRRSLSAFPLGLLPALAPRAALARNDARRKRQRSGHDGADAPVVRRAGQQGTGSEDLGGHETRGRCVIAPWAHGAGYPGGLATEFRSISTEPLRPVCAIRTVRTHVTRSRQFISMDQETHFSTRLCPRMERARAIATARSEEHHAQEYFTCLCSTADCRLLW